MATLTIRDTNLLLGRQPESRGVPSIFDVSAIC